MILDRLGVAVREGLISPAHFDLDSEVNAIVVVSHEEFERLKRNEHPDWKLVE